MPIELPEYLQEMLVTLGEPKNVWKYMLAVTQIPRGSNKENERFRHLKILAFLKEQAEELGCTTYVDQGENLIITKAATPGYEDKPTVCLQCHMDMVVQKNDDVDIDLDNDPLKPRIDGKYLKATGTSLGADNGIGIATCFAILEDKELIHGPLEILVTRDEETGLYGADELEPGILKAKYMINVDSEEEGAVCVGCAGGFTVHMTMPTPRSEIADLVKKEVILNNFVGGHSGVDINLGRCNINGLIGRLLKAYKEEFYILDIECGTAHNAIPRKLVLNVGVKNGQLFEETMKKEFDKFYHEYKLIEKDSTITVQDSKCETLPMSYEASKNIIDLLNTYPSGVIRMSPSTEGAIETSTTLAIVTTKNVEEIKLTASVRSFSETQMDYMYNRIKSHCDVVGMKVSEKIGAYPGWEPKVDSPLTLALVKAYKEVLGNEPRVYAIHAGLECGLFMKKYPNLDCSSIGPELNFPHSPDERLMIESVPRFYKSVEIALKDLCQ